MDQDETSLVATILQIGLSGKGYATNLTVLILWIGGHAIYYPV